MMKFIRSIVDFRDPKKELLWIITLCFLISFSIARMYSTYFSAYVYIQGYHIHHFYFGTIALTIGGILGVLSKKQKALRLASVLIGVGMGLFADEIGLLLNCTSLNKICTYAFPDTVDIISSILLGLLVIIILTDITEAYSKRKG